MSVLEISIIALSLVCLAAVFYGFNFGLKKSPNYSEDQKYRIFNRVVLIFMAWVAAFMTLSYQGIFTDFSSFPPKLMVVPFAPLIAVIALSYTGVFKAVILHIPQHWLVGFQSFRVLVEIILWAMFAKGILPEQMTFEGRNFDILVGLLAPIASWIFYKNGGKCAWLWNVFGLVLLINIVGIAILSMPTPIRVFYNDPPNTIVATFPYISIPGIYVPVAYTLHIFSLRKWWLERKNHV